MDTTASTVRPRKKRLRLTLGAFMILILLIGGAMAWIARRASTQRVAVAAIRGAKGNVVYEFQISPRGLYDKNAKPRGSKWWRDALGGDVFDSVKTVSIPGENLNDKVMAQISNLDLSGSLMIFGGNARSPGLTTNGISRLRDLRHLRGLQISWGETESNEFLSCLGDQKELRGLTLIKATPTDADLARIGRLTDLEYIKLDGKKVTDKGFAHIATLKKLKILVLPGCQVTDLSPLRGLTDLKGLTIGPQKTTGSRARPVCLVPLHGLMELDYLALGDTAIDDAGLEVLKSLPKLEFLETSSGWITEGGLAHLANMPKLQSLQLRGMSLHDFRPLGTTLLRLTELVLEDSSITDNDLKSLAGATGLSELNLNRTQITDAGLAHLVGLTALSRLSLEETQITDASVVHLAKLPSLKQLSILGTKITPAGIRGLKTTFPRIQLVATKASL